jgi:hypothetical protein
VEVSHSKKTQGEHRATTPKDGAVLPFSKASPGAPITDLLTGSDRMKSPNVIGIPAKVRKEAFRSARPRRSRFASAAARSLTASLVPEVVAVPSSCGIIVALAEQIS